jgi:hypothetical protein
MAKHRNYVREANQNRNEPHPIWRGIGCFIMLLVPALSLGISFLLIEMALSAGVQLPPGLLGYPLMPNILFRVPGLVGILNWIQGLNNLYAILLVAFTVAILLTGLFALGYAFIYRLVGPSRYSGFDAPPPSIKVKKYKR